MAESKRATETAMEDLHGALCGYFLKLIGGQIPEMEKVKETDEESGAVREVWKETGLAVRPGAGDLAVMAKFLKDNAITGAATDGSELSELEKALAKRHSTRKGLPSTRDVQEAIREVGAGLLN